VSRRPVGSPPSSLFLEHFDSLRAARRLGPVLDLACGRGRHALAAAQAGLPVVGVDLSRAHLADLQARAEAAGVSVPCVRTDLERPDEIPFQTGTCGGILVFRFLFRALAPVIETLLAPGGLLLYETFTIAQRDRPYGPSSPAFLLEPGELPALFSGLEVLSYREVETDAPRPDAVARLVARRSSRARSLT